MTPTEQIERLRELETKATAGPWFWEHIAEDREVDCQLIAAARNALPALLEVASAATEFLESKQTTERDTAINQMRAALSRLGEVQL